VEPKELVDRLDEAESHKKGLLMYTANLAVAAALSTVKYHDPWFDCKRSQRTSTCSAW
jgi:hypothetical protein